MKVLVINGSPKGNASNTFRLTSALIEGLEENEGVEVEVIKINDLQITPCLGCMSCWGKTAGKCVIDDVMTDIHKKVMEADIIVESFPLFFFGMPGPMKVFTDRMMPLMETYKGISKTIGNKAFHETRYDMSGKKLVLVSTCGYAKTDEIYDSLIKEYNFICGEGNYMKLFTPQGEMFAIPQLQPQINVYLERYREIGRALGRRDEVTEEMIDKTHEPILLQRAFETLVNNYWNSCK